ncbi:hypothetical protein CAOG_02760 [Capsaspora owczarzaki ATCC 30864]|uniref:hypothetical protein n=1 Tax=Capsaspora owczarzaki (strain ATCC 30864) TaxID=595528 RepID=UPI0001FE4A24|nr:hypothetical protein CAOG_02760 [Capsaspora owczarzaki ATCC 30864]|eukprot:XP_004349510.1 hypothetical protein CAOG_02760 [Capsaspora owczarzaki ATCC 30864]
MDEPSQAVTRRGRDGAPDRGTTSGPREHYCEAEPHQAQDAEEDENEDEQDEQDVVERSVDQRAARPGEPVCAVCGRYGEYICDQTDQDVCSMECKATAVAGARWNKEPESTRPCHPSASASQATAANTEAQAHSHQAHASIEQLRARLGVTITAIGAGESTTLPPLPDVPPVDAFADLDSVLPDKLLDNLYRSGCNLPSLVQKQLLPLALTAISPCERALTIQHNTLNGAPHSMVVTASTGSGKTLSLALVAIAHAVALASHSPSASQPGSHPSVLVLSPTRELCVQIQDNIKRLAEGIPNLRTALLAGGFPLPPQLHRLSQAVAIVVATPGRLMEILAHPRGGGVSLAFDQLRVLILDEVDALALGDFRTQVLRVVQDLVFHAGSSFQAQQQHAQIYGSRQRPVPTLWHLAVGTPAIAADEIKQVLMWVEEKSKPNTLCRLLNAEQHYRPPVLVLVNSLATAKALPPVIIKRCATECDYVSSERTQDERNAVMARFVAGEFPILVATGGIAGRGLTLGSVGSVINLDFPRSIDAYIHHIGRATRRVQTTLPRPNSGLWRSQSAGLAYTFLNLTNEAQFVPLMALLEPAGVVFPPEVKQSMAVFRHRERLRFHPPPSPQVNEATPVLVPPTISTAPTSSSLSTTEDAGPELNTVPPPAYQSEAVPVMPAIPLPPPWLLSPFAPPFIMPPGLPPRPPFIPPPTTHHLPPPPWLRPKRSFSNDPSDSRAAKRPRQ